MLKVGIIGFGKMGQIRAEAIHNSGRGKVVAVYDPSSLTDSLPSVQTADEIINNPSIEAVFICTPNFRNMPLTIQALNADKHVFCEKPPAFTASEMELIQLAEKQSGKILMYGFNHRHHGSIKNMKSLIDSGEYGNIIWMRGRYGKSVDKDFSNSWRSKSEMAGGGILIDQGIHMLDLFLYFSGEFDDVHAVISDLYWNLGIEDNVFATLHNTQTGVVASLHSTMTQWRHLFSLEIFLENGYLVLNGLSTSSGTYGDEVLGIAKNRSRAPAATWEDEERITYHTDQSWASEIDEFFLAIRENKPIRNGNSDDALKLMKLLDKIYLFKEEISHGT
jgi:1,5-anhydro-D-fructose reductase (1,5-anhydro-D-mannitol-forming)